MSQQRVEGVFSASPVAADGKVYFVSENGETIVMQAGRTPTVLARNDLGERAIASPAISNGQIFIRTDDHVFAIGPATTVAARCHGANAEALSSGPRQSSEKKPPRLRASQRSPRSHIAP